MVSPGLRRASLAVALASVSAGCATARQVAALHAMGTPPCDDVMGLGEVEAARRLGLIAPRLKQAQDDTRTWWVAWLALLGGGAALQGGLIAPVHDHAWRVDLAIGGAGALIAAVPLAATPRAGLDVYDRLRAALAAAPGPAARLCAAERLLAEAATDAAVKQAWPAHVIGDAAAVALGLVQWLAFGHLRSGIITAVGGSLGNELLVFTQATRVVGDYVDYRAFVADVAPTPQARLRLGVAPPGLTLALTF